MTEDIKDIVDFSCLKDCIIKSRTTSRYVAEAVGLTQVRISRIITGWDNPKTDIIAKLAWALKVPCSEFVKFKGIKPNASQKKWFEEHQLKYKPGDTGELTYAPLWELLDGFLEDVNKDKTEDLKTVNDILDTIEPYRRVNGIGGNGLTKEQLQDMVKKSVEVRYGKDYVAKRTNRGPYEAKGLTPETRTKLRNDRPLSVRTIYEICKKLGCSIDWVMSYK